MKKLFVLLLSLAVVGGVFAQTFALGASGGITLIDQDTKAKFARDGSGYDLITIKGSDKDGKWGYSAVLNDFDKAYTATKIGDDSTGATGDADTLPDLTAEVTPFTALRNWDAWYKMGDFKVILGNVRNGDIRMTLPEGWEGNNCGATDRFLAGPKYGVIGEYSKDALTFGLALPIPEAGADSVDTFKKLNAGAKYKVDAMTAIALAELDLVAESNIINLGFNFTGVENLNLVAISKITLATDTKIGFGVGGYYTMDKLYAGVEFDALNSTAFAWEVVANADYTVNDNISAQVRVFYDDSGDYYAYGKGKYDFGNGLDSSLKVGYDKDDSFIYALALGYSISF